MPIDKDSHMIFEGYSKPFVNTPNKVLHNAPSTLNDVKKSTPATSGSELDVKGQLSDKGMAGNTPVNVSEEDSEAPSHDELINMFDTAVNALKKHIKKAKHEQADKKD